jgi:hypothetical protein
MLNQETGDGRAYGSFTSMPGGARQCLMLGTRGKRASILEKLGSAEPPTERQQRIIVLSSEGSMICNSGGGVESFTMHGTEDMVLAESLVGDEGRILV